MTPTVETTLADHGARIVNVEEKVKTTDSKLDRLLIGVVLTLLTTIGELLVHVAAGKH